MIESELLASLRGKNVNFKLVSINSSVLKKPH